jgi:O-acetyl-ADP-ribose deacetylase (regulator of RNase III)
MVQSVSADYAVRTEQNVRDSDATLRIAFNWNSPGEIRTAKAIADLEKPHFDIGLDEHMRPDPERIAKAIAWLRELGPIELNVAGNSEKTAPGISAAAEEIIYQILVAVVGKKGSIIEADGDMFRVGAEALVCPVNSRGIMGAGLAKVFARDYPGACTIYREDCASGVLVPGGVTSAIGKPIIYFAATKDDPHQDSQMAWVDASASELADRAIADGVGSIAVPAMGAGLGKLPADEVRKVLLVAAERMAAAGITVYLFPPKMRKDPWAKRNQRDVDRDLAEARAKVAAEVTRRASFGADIFSADDFIESKAIENYPYHQEDVDAENAVTAPQVEQPLRDALVHAVKCALALGDSVCAHTPTAIAQWLITSHDDHYAVDMPDLPLPALSVERTLAHVESLRLGLQPRVAISLARRAVVILRCHSREAALPKPRPRAPRGQDEPIPDQDEPPRPPPEPREDPNVRKQKLREHVKLNGPFPIMHVDLTGDRAKIYMEKAEDIFGVKAVEIHHQEKRDREVMEYCSL